MYPPVQNVLACSVLSFVSVGTNNVDNTRSREYVTVVSFRAFYLFGSQTAAGRRKAFTQVFYIGYR